MTKLPILRFMLYFKFYNQMAIFGKKEVKMMIEILEKNNLYDLSQVDTSSVNAGALIVTVLLIIAMWKIFTKAGESGWKSIIPVYNLYILCKIADGNGWKFLLLLIPIVHVIYYIILMFRLAVSFGKGVLFTLGLLFLPNLFTLILGFGKSQYFGPRGRAN